MKPLDIYTQMLQLLAAMRDAKPDERSKERWAVAITEMEKEIAYFRTYIVKDAEW